MSLRNEKLQVRCEFCRFKPLLAVCGRDIRTGEPYVHIKSYRGKKIYTQAIVTEGIVWIMCRDCERWHSLKIRKVAVDVQEATLPPSLVVR